MFYSNRPIAYTKFGNLVQTMPTPMYDSYGRPIWMKDGEGFLSHTAYDTATGAAIKTIADVDTTQTTTFMALPTGWATPTGGGLHLTSTYEVDFLGRTTKATDPAGRVDYTVYLDNQFEVRSYPAWDSTTNTSTGPTTVSRQDRNNGYTESITLSATPSVASGRPTGAEAITSIESLSRSYTNAAGQTTHSDSYFDLTGASYTTSTNFGVEGTNFYRTRQGYDHQGRGARSVTAAGTITRMVYDGQERLLSSWVGTDDTPTTGEWSPTNTAGTNLVQVSAYEYDNGGVGDGNVTSVTQMPGGSAADRVSETFYDWRNRPVAAKQGVETSEASSVNRPISYTEYDNLGQTVASEIYDGDGVDITFLGGVPERPSASLLRAKSTAKYDEWGRVYRGDSFSVDPISGTVSINSLRSEVWFNERGLPIKSNSLGGLVEKVAYDGLRRAMTVYTTDGGGDVSWADADDVTSDIVLSQSEIQYDAVSNVLLGTVRERFHNAIGTGALGTPSNGINARVSYMAMYYDGAYRITGLVAVGTNSGMMFTRPTSVPTRSDTVLVTDVEYNSAGRAFKMTDPHGFESRTYYDLLTRTTKTIENYVDGVISDTDDKTTKYEYGSAGMTKLIAMTSASSGQTTGWDFGVTTTSGSKINSNDIIGTTKWPHPTDGVPSSEQDTLLVNALGQSVSAIDRNGNIHNFEYDILGRMVSDTATTLGTGVDGKVRRVETAYNGQGNPHLLTSFDATTSGNIVNQVKREFNGLSQLTVEWQSHSGAVVGSTPKVQYAYSEMAGAANHSRPTSVTYPNGRMVSRIYDAGLDSNISRLSSLSDGAVTLEGYEYLGLSSVVERNHAETGVDLSYIKRSGESNGDAGDQYVGLDRFGRIDDQRWLDTSTGVAVDRYGYSYDRDGNRIERVNLVNSSFNEIYTYDGLNQLSNFSRSTTRSKSWDYDALGNWDSVTTDSVTETRGHNEQNEISSVSGATTPTYDANGNMTGDETGRQFVYDAWNRLIAVKDAVGTTLIEYSYDAMNHRISEDSGTTTDFYYSTGWQVLEEQVGSVTTHSYVWSPVYSDSMITRDSDSDGNGTLDDRLYVLHDANFNVTGLVNISGNVVERFVYDPFGTAKVFDMGWGLLNRSEYGWRYLHQGGRLDVLSGLYHFRNRDYSPVLGRWSKNDPINFSGHDNNLYNYVANNPIGYVDGLGLSMYFGDSGGNPITGYYPILDESDYIKKLEETYKEWQRNGWTYSAHLLEHFLLKIKNKQQRDHQATPGEVEEVYLATKDLILDMAYNEHFDDISCKDLKLGHSFSVSEYVRFYPSIKDSQLGNLHSWGKVLASDYQIRDTNLFYALGGATVKFDAKVTKLVPIGSVRGFNCFEVTFSADITITDHYTFVPIGLRGISETYKFAYYLQKNHGYLPFDTNIKILNKSYTKKLCCAC